MTSPDIFEPMLRTVRTLWGALLASTCLLTVLSVVLDNHHVVAPPTFAVVFSVCAMATAVASFVIPARAAAQTVKQGEVELAPGRAVPGSTQPIPTFADPRGAARTAFGRAFIPFMLSVALSEAVCLFGFALHMTGGPVQVSGSLALFGVALVAARFPTAKNMVARFERAHGAKFEVDAR